MNQTHASEQSVGQITLDASSFSQEFLDCHTSCYQTLLSGLGLQEKHVEVTRVMIVFDVTTIYEMIENLDLYGYICETCAKRALDIFSLLKVRNLLQKKGEESWN